MTKLDDRLVQTLLDGDVRLVKASWFKEQLRLKESKSRILDRQTMERDFPEGLCEPQAAAELIRGCGRKVGVLSYGWLTPDNPDPMGDRFKLLGDALDEQKHIEAVFWDYPSLYQKSATEGDRTIKENASFKRAIAVMGDLYASVAGTTVLQSKEVPKCPEEFANIICLFDLKDGMGEKEIRAALAGVGEIKDVKITGYPNALVTFASPPDAKAVSKAVTVLCKGSCPYYNGRSYDERGW